MPTIDEYVTVGPRAAVDSEALIAAAGRLGFEPSAVRRTATAYIVPAQVADEFRRSAGRTASIEDSPEKSSFPDDSWKIDDIKAWAEAHTVDLGNATKKADMLAAIQAADTKEE
jgi:hypothetical protein